MEYVGASVLLGLHNIQLFRMCHKLTPDQQLVASPATTSNAAVNIPGIVLDTQWCGYKKTSWGWAGIGLHCVFLPAVNESAYVPVPLSHSMLSNL